MGISLNVKPIESQQIRVIELEHGILLANNYYRKEDITPVSMIGESFNLSTGNNVLGIKTHMALGTGINVSPRRSDFGIIADPFIENRYYTVLNNQYANANNSYNYLCAFNDDGTNATFISSHYVNGVFISEIIEITEKYIFVITKNVSYPGQQDVYYINKKTSVMTLLVTIASQSGNFQGYAKLVYKNEVFLYVLARDGYSVIRMLEIDKETLVVNQKTLYQPTRTWTDKITNTSSSLGYTNDTYVFNNSGVLNENFYEEDGKYYFIMPILSGDRFPGADGTACENLAAYCIDSNYMLNDSRFFTLKNINIAHNKELTWGAANPYCLTANFWVIDNFLYYSVFSSYQGNTANLASQGIHMFKITAGFELEWLSVNRISPNNPIMSILFNSDKSVVIIGYWQFFEILKRNTVTGVYEQTKRILSSIMTVGFDAFDRLWYQKMDNTIHVQNLDDPNVINMNFEQNYYTYENQDINTYIMFEAISFLDTPASGKYILTLGGNAKFINGTKTHEFIYSEGNIKIDIIVYGPNHITCDTKFIKVW